LQIVNATVGIYSFSDVSPDGRSIAIVLDGKWTICDFPACTTRKPASITGFLPRWTPDGRGLSYVDQGTVPGSASNLWVQPIDGSAARQLTRFTDGRSIGSYSWSRDARLAISLASFISDIVLFSGLKGKPVMSPQ
jgi:Tol biopolymer transport system component